jgi:hypothetical protein
MAGYYVFVLGREGDGGEDSASRHTMEAKQTEGAMDTLYRLTAILSLLARTADQQTTDQQTS